MNHDYTEIKACIKTLRRAETMPKDTAKRFIKAWGNTHWSASADYLQAVCVEARRSTGAILECGSGLSTIILAAVAADLKIYSLEHREDFYDDTQQALEQVGLADEVQLLLSPLRVRRRFSWYTPDRSMLPAFNLVICDGPPGGVKGGRYGLIPVMKHKLADGCVVLLDDAARKKEREVLKQWKTETGAKISIVPAPKAFARITMP